ncbi:hypothetical protein [Verrucomicrobium spinosum]|uniref:hypothetical protein n=1 Tax=Verrucomicrobium spinosum TaxID=2736 RepID=UPI0012E1217E|nr:hypothetical protein [Verrucomicrobium spinosum]
MLAPHGTSTAGRININSQVQPYGDAAQVTSPLERFLPLVALLTGVAATTSTGDCDTISIAKARTIARNIYNRTLAAKGKKYGYAETYDSPGEIVEIAGVADGGEESEAVVRGIASLVTTRGGVFMVYSIGQALKQTPNGNLVITAESRQQTMLERYSAASAVGVTRFRRLEHQPCALKPHAAALVSTG